MRKQWIMAMSAAILAALCGGVANAANTTLDTVYVDANKDQNQDTVGTFPGGFVKESANIGILGNKDVMDTPFAVTTVSQKAIKTFASPYNGINDVLTFDPSVRILSGALYQDISIRGFSTNGHRQYVNGIPGLLNQENIPYYWVDNVSVVSGPNLGVNGTSLSEAIGGTVNYTSKRAVRNGTDVKFTYCGGKSFEEGVDFQKRFSNDNRYGVRVTANNISGETVVDHEKLQQQNVFVNLDQKTTYSNTNLLIGYNHTKHYAGPYGISFQFSPFDKDGNPQEHVTVLPNAPDASKNYKPSWSYNDYDNWIIALNHDQKLSDHVTAFVNAGYHRENWFGYIDGSPKVINNNGDFQIGISNFPLFLVKEYAGAGIKGDFKTGSVKHDYVVGVDKSWERYDIDDGNPHYSWSGTGNIYQDNSWANPGDAHWKPAHSDDTQMVGWHIVDTMKALNDDLQFTVGVHGHKATVYNADGSQRKSDAISPTYALSYKFTPNFMMYVDHTESFGMGSRVAMDLLDENNPSSGRKYVNAGKMLDPAKTKQNEVGFKVKTGNFLNTFSYFEIKQANPVDVAIPNSSQYLRTLDGEQKNRGFEWAFTGNLNQKWDLIGGLMYIDVEQAKTQGGKNDGKPVDGIPHWTGTFGAVYHPNSQWSFIGKANYVGSSKINSNTMSVPSSFVFDLGAAYDTTIGGTPVTFSAMLYNVAGKDYWISRGSSSSLALGAPRTFVLSANFRM